MPTSTDTIPSDGDTEPDVAADSRRAASGERSLFIHRVFVLLIALTLHAGLISLTVYIRARAKALDDSLMIVGSLFDDGKNAPEAAVEEEEDVVDADASGESDETDESDPLPAIAEEPVENTEPEDLVDPASGIRASETEDTDGIDEWVTQRGDPEARRRALEAHGGDERSEGAVARGLEWLARHQSTDGRWDADGFWRHTDEPDEDQAPGDAFCDVGITGLALLAFLAAGNTCESGEYRDPVSLAVGFLLYIQREDGSFRTGPATRDDIAYSPKFMYDQGIVLLALSECYIMDRNKELREPIEKALAFVEAARQECGGWDYQHYLSTKRGDLSVTSWIVLALSSCAKAGFDVPESTLSRVRVFVAGNVDDSGMANYAIQEVGGKLKGVPNGFSPSAYAAVSLIYLGDEPAESSKLRSLRSVLEKHPPNWVAMTGGDNGHSLYYWYYGTLAMFHMGSRHWRAWNAVLKRELLENQRLDEGFRGSWDPAEVSPYAPSGGRLYSTVFAVLSLEVYYRYIPMYRRWAASKTPAREPATRGEILDVLRGRRTTARDILDALVDVPERLPDEEIEKAVGGFLFHDDISVRWRAVAILTGMEKPPAGLGARLVDAYLADATTFRFFILDKIGELGDKSAIEGLIGALEKAELEESAVDAERIGNTLEAITGESFGISSDKWIEWFRGVEELYK